MATVFIDRDGTINEDKGFVHRVEDLLFLPGSREGLKLLANAALDIVIFTNQSGIGRKLFTEEDFQGFMSAMITALKKDNIIIQDVLFCHHKPDDNCNCRKPSPLLIENYALEHGIDLSSCFVVGDRLSDVETGINAGCMTVLINKEPDMTVPDMTSLAKATTEALALQDAQNKIFPDFVADDLVEAAEWIIIQKNIINKEEDDYARQN